MSAMNDLFHQAMQLPEDERLALAARLLTTVEPAGDDPDCEAAWAEELEARLDKVAHGQYTAADWREALARIRQSLSKTSAL
jgi:putative addiction module component (TIGR02574 family)